MAADLALVRRLEAIGRRSVCLIFSTDPPGLASVQWTTGELDESDAQLADLARRVLAQRDRKLSGLRPEWRQQICGGQADLDSFGVIDAEFARSSAPPDATAPADGSAGLVTVIGRFLQAVIAGDTAARRRLQGELNGGLPGWNHDEAGLVQVACELAAPRLWAGGDHNAGDIADTVSFVREANQARGKTPPGQAEMEAVIRSALGDTDADTASIIPPVVFEIQAGFTGYVALKLRWPPQLTAALLARAEQVAGQRGWKPPLAQMTGRTAAGSR